MDKKPCSTRARRGVLLLVVLSLLAMFGLIAITYLIVTNQARRAAQSFERVDQYSDPPELELHQAAMQVIRGTRTPNSAIGLHSLLEDMYGGEFVECNVNDSSTGKWFVAAAYKCNGQFVAIPAPDDKSLSLQDKMRRVGCLLTMTTGPCAGQSSRIVSFQRSPSLMTDPSKIDDYYKTDPDLFLVMAFQRQTIDASGTAVYINGAQLDSGNYLLNGVPFSGTGFGYDPSSGNNDLADNNSRPFALLPRPFLSVDDYNTYLKYVAGSDGTLGTTDDVAVLYDHPMFLSATDKKTYLAGSGTRYVATIQSNEDYDAADFQNMLPAMIVTQTDGTKETAKVLSPSLHRPELINYWDHKVTMTDDLRRRICLRPNTIDHPNFTGGNPGFDWINGPWDVDNDRDLVNDSIWVDLGATVRSAPDGRMYKPLYAILLQDLDSRANVNAHGSTAQYDSATYTGATKGPYANQYGTDGTDGEVTLPRGEGYGTADIYPGCAGGVLDSAQFANLLRGSSALGVEGRYGENTGGTAEAGTTGSWSTLGLLKHYEFPDQYTDILTSGALDSTKISSFGTPPDLWGRGCLGVDHRGQPYYWRSAWTNEVLNNPYWLNLSRNVPRPATNSGTTADNPFTVAELERILRQFDGDAGMLASRLAALAPGLLYSDTGDPTKRRFAEITVESNDLPVPASNTGWTTTKSGFTHGRSLVELLRARVLHERGITSPTTDDENTVFTEISKLMAWELMLNRRFNLNRPFGNGRNDSSGAYDKYVADEVGEASSESSWKDLFSSQTGAVPFLLHNGLDVNGDGSVDDKDRALARQLYARHLFVMALLLVDCDYLALSTPTHYAQDPTADSDVPACADADLDDAQRRELTVRRLAQWAVNVVDFRDADSAMTPFEYVMNPFGSNGWYVDGDLATNEDSGGTTAERRVVWGCEYPEMLLTETLAFHDRRVADTAWDNGSQKKRDPTDPTKDDTTLDQPRIPQGSAFFELYCTRNPNNFVAPADLYTLDTDNKWKLDLARMAPSSGSTPAYPVWRLVITETTITGDHENNVWERFNNATYGRAYSFTPDLASPSLLLTPPTGNNGDKKLTIDRIVWFANSAPNKYGETNPHEKWNRIFYGRSTSSSNYLLGPAHYAVVGPRAETWVGAESGKTLGTHCDQVITLKGVSVDNATTGTGAYTYPDSSTIQVPLGIVVAADRPPNWSAAGPGANGIGISISEPLPYSDESSSTDTNYYPEPTIKNDSTNVVEAYGDLNQADSTKLFRDEPLDSQTGRPLKEENLLTTKTTANYKTVLLQRLADPLKAYNAITNPYLTVDWMPIDLTVFNGEDRAPTGWDASVSGPWDPDDSNPTADSNVSFEPRRRGSGSTINPWYPVFTGPGSTSPDAAFTANFRHHLGNPTLGYLNETYKYPWSKKGHSQAAPDDYVGSAVTNAPDWTYTTPTDPGDKLPFPWLTWNNRPFANPMEVFLVPSSHPGRLCREFGMYPKRIGSGDPENRYDGPLAPLNAPYAHLLNSFGSKVPTDADPKGSAHLYRILDYVETPSRFVGTETVLDPKYFQQVLTETVFYRPPYNMVSEYRDPGRININMITGTVDSSHNATSRVWESLLNGHPGPSFADFVASRRGFKTTGADWWYAEDTGTSPATYYPTRFGNPFRSAGGAGMVTSPITAMAHPINATLLRGEIEFASPPTAPDEKSAPFFGGTSTTSYINCERNAYFHYQGLGHLSNLITTRSNVYALWITVGYFQVEPNPAGIDAGHPDGFRLGQELGSDTGGTKRHRAFYIIDRTIPVGFQRGVDLNTENTILLKRIIE